jgi:hypothetical protein
VVARIDLFAAVLADRNANARTRVEALKFVTHFVGDVHQPLHAEDHNDKGGNRIRVANYLGHASLHSIWDTDMIEADDSDAHAFARRLDASISDDDVRRWQAGSPSDWANESHALAVTAYALLDNPSAGAEISIPDSYVVTERPVIELQLKRAGIRLAMVLNRALDR